MGKAWHRHFRIQWKQIFDDCRLLLAIPCDKTPQWHDQPEYGLPANIIANFRSQYISERFKTKCEQSGITLHCSSPYHHQANSLAERSIGTCKTLLRKMNAHTQPYGYTEQLHLMSKSHHHKNTTNYGHGNLFFFQFVSSPIVWYLAFTQDQWGPKLNLWLPWSQSQRIVKERRVKQLLRSPEVHDWWIGREAHGML